MENFKGRKVQIGPRGGLFVQTGKSKQYVPKFTTANRIGGGQGGDLFRISSKLVAKRFKNDSGPREMNMMLHVRKAPFVPKIRYLNRAARMYYMDALPDGTETYWKWISHHTPNERKLVDDQVHRNIAILHKKFKTSHGDLHELNVMVDPSGKVWIIDFGLSQRFNNQENNLFRNKIPYAVEGGIPVYNFGFPARRDTNMLRRYPPH
jgi:hypothetical protein